MPAMSEAGIYSWSPFWLGQELDRAITRVKRIIRSRHDRLPVLTRASQFAKLRDW